MRPVIMFTRVWPVTTAIRGVMVIKNRILLILLLAGLNYASAQTTVSAQGRITYLTTELVYCDLGSEAGAAVGDTLTVWRRNDEIGLIVVTNLSRNYSVCRPLAPVDQFLLGDRVVLEKTVTMTESAPLVVKPEPEQTSPRQPDLSHRGNLSWRYSGSRFSGSSYSRTVATLNYNLSIDRPLAVRFSLYGNRNFTDRRWNIYQFQLALGSVTDRLCTQLGRVYATELAGIGITDGAHLSFRISENLSSGLIGGLQPVPGSLDYSTDVRKLGVYGSYRRNRGERRFGTSLAMIGQYFSDGIDREFIYHNLRWETGHWIDISFNQTIDLDRRDDLAYRNTMEWTSLQTSVRLKPHRAVTVTSRLSTRRRMIYRSVYGNRADSLFSDELRTGWYNSLNLRSEKIGSLQLSTNVKTESGTHSNANFAAVKYSSPRLSHRWSFNLGVDYLKNQLLNGMRVQSGLNLFLTDLGSLYGEYEIFTYGYGNRKGDYLRHSLSANFNWQIRSRWTGMVSAEMFKDDTFSGGYLFTGITYRL